MREHHASIRNFRKFLCSSTQTCARRRAHSRPDAWTNSYVAYSDVDESALGSGPLQGKSIALKDNICTKSFKTTCSSAMLRDFVSPYDATVVRLLRASGAKIVGKTNCDEFGMGSNNIHSVHGPVLNPHQPPSRSNNHNREKRSAGGSSGGSAAAVASGSCFASIGTDTGGSVRLPASYCGVAGLKPSYGLISRWGVISYADSLDCVGVLAKSSKDINCVFDVLSKHDSKDPTSVTEEIRSKTLNPVNTLLERRRNGVLEGLKVGIPQEYFPEELDKDVVHSLKRLIKLLRKAGADVVPISLPSTLYALSAYYVIASAEASSNLARYSGIHYGSRETLPPGADKRVVSDVYAHTRSKAFGHEVQKRILLGSYALTADAFDNYFLQAQRVRQLIRRDFNRTLIAPSPLSNIERSSRHKGVVDVIIHPSAIGPAPSLEALDKTNFLDAYMQDVLTVPASLAGLPALSIPMGLEPEGWPLGVSIVGQWGYDKFVLEVGSAIENILN